MWSKALLHSSALCLYAFFGPATADPPNILMIVADDLGWNDVSWHNPEVIMPTLDKLARKGLILENNYVQPTCSPSRSALLTGYYPIHTGMQFFPLQPTAPVGLPIKFKLLPEYLKDLGYSTHLAGKWHLGFCSPDYQPTNRGFDSYRGLWLGEGNHYQHEGLGFDVDATQSIGYDFHINEDIDLSVIGTDTSEIIADTFSTMLSERVGLQKQSKLGYTGGPINMTSYNTSKPFFFQASFQDVHSPLQVQAEYEAMYPNVIDPARRKLLGMVSRLDDTVGRMIQDLERFSYTKGGKSRSMLEDTAIIFTSDNGGMAWGLGYAGGSNHPLRGRKGDTLEGGCRVPGFVYNFGRSGVTDQLIHISDWLPTIYSGLAGGNKADLPEDLDGINQIEHLTQAGGVSLRDEILYDIINFETTNYTLILFPGLEFSLGGSFGAALRYKDYKIIMGCSSMLGCDRDINAIQGGNERIQLYNLVTDPGETTDLSNDHFYLDILNHLKERIMIYLDGAAPPLQLPNVSNGMPQQGQFVTGWCEPIYDPFVL